MSYSAPPPPPPGPGPFPGSGPGQFPGIRSNGGSGYAQPIAGEWQKGSGSKANLALSLAVAGIFCGVLQVPAIIYGYQAFQMSKELDGLGRNKALVAMFLPITLMAIWIVCALIFGTQKGA